MEIKNSWFFFRSPRKGPPRYALYFSKSGRWFVAFTLLVCLVTFSTDNNILYLMSSLLLATIFISGIFSDLAFYRTSLNFSPANTFANEYFPDAWVIINPTPIPILGVEVGIFQDGNFIPSARIPYLAPLKSLQISSSLVLSERGEQNWDQVYISTGAPFGFSQKTRFFKNSGRRLVWPSRGPIDATTKTQFLLRNQFPPEPNELVPQAGNYHSDVRKVYVQKSNFDLDEIILKNFDVTPKSSRSLFKFKTVADTNGLIPESEELLTFATFLLSQNFPVEILLPDGHPVLGLSDRRAKLEFLAKLQKAKTHDKF